MSTKVYPNILFRSKTYSSPFPVPAYPYLPHERGTHPQEGECCFLSVGHIVSPEGEGFYVGTWDQRKMDWLNNGIWIVRDCLYGDPSNLYWVPLGRALSKNRRWMNLNVYGSRETSA